MIGETNAHYRVTAQLGEGGRAKSSALTTRAWAVTSPSSSRENEFSERSKREARSIAALNHPRRLYDVGAANCSAGSWIGASSVWKCSGPQHAFGRGKYLSQIAH